MTFGGFKETSESMENNEAKTENTEKKRNQILEIPDEYKDDFDKKIETSENKEQQTDIEKKDTPEGGEKTGWFEKIKGFFSKEKENNIEKEDEPEKSEKPDKHSSFIDSLKVDMSPEEVKEYNAEHGYTDEVTERPKGGVEREKTLENEDSRWEAYDTPEENTEDTTNDSL